MFGRYEAIQGLKNLWVICGQQGDELGVGCTQDVVFFRPKKKAKKYL